MRNFNALLSAIAVFFTFTTFAQYPSEGYVRYDFDGMPRQVMNLEVKQFTGSDAEIANQFLVANKSWICGGENGNYEFASVIENPSGKHFTYIQKVLGIPVLGSGLVISVNNNHYISHVYNGYHKNLNPTTVPVITAQQAIDLALNTFDNPGLQFLLTPTSELYIYENENHIVFLVYKVVIYSTDNGSYQVLVNAINSTIINKSSLEYGYETGTGRVWDPNPEALGIPHIDPDHDVDDPSYAPAYVTRSLEGLNSPVSGLYNLKGEYASSYELAAPVGLIPGQTTSNFLFNRSQIGFEETNCYYHTDKILRYINTLGFSPTWNNQTTTSNKDIVFDARAGYQGDYPVYMGNGQVKFPYPSGFAPGVDAGEDESVIVHEIGHAVHDALLPFGISGGGHIDLYGISEGIANYFGIDYRRQTSPVKSTWASTWYMPGDLISNSLNFATNWVTALPRTCSGVWASALFDLEYISATDPTQGYKLGREVVSKNQISSLSYLTNNSSRIDNVLAMYQADLDTYEGLHLRVYIDVYHNRQLFNDQNVYGNISTNQNWSGYKKINSTIHALSGTTINIAANSIVVMDGELLVDQGATLNIGANVRFIGYTSTHRVVIAGNSTIGNNVTFKFVGIPGSTDYFAGLSLMNQSQAVTLNNATFTKSRLFHNGGGLTVTNSTFTDCNKIMSYRGNITYSNCTFTKTGLSFENQTADAGLLVNVNYCNMNGQQLSSAIEITGYKKFIVDNNTIQNYVNGIRIFNGGLGTPNNQIINHNSVFSCSYLGLTCYYSYADITMNRIYNNIAGVGLYNTSTTKISGDQNAANILGTQQIMDNSSYEVLISRSSFPSLFKWNYISDYNNGGGEADPLVYYLPPTGGGLLSPPNVKYNCWGTNFVAAQDLYCSTGCTFLYDPQWCPSGKKSGYTYEDAEIQFNNALELLGAGNYLSAKDAFKSIVQEYHNTIFAESSLKELYRVEELTSNDYNTLKQYYLTNDSINIASNLIELADNLANKCNEKLGNYQDCINWYENKILTSQSEDDSIFAAIDLGYLYLLMQNSGLKSTQTGQLKAFIPENQSKFEENRDYLLSLLPGKSIDNPGIMPIKNLPFGKLLQNNPNPFIDNTEVWYKLEKEANVTINISDFSGRFIKRVVVGSANSGINKVLVNSEGLSSGVYLYSLVIDGVISDTKKMSIIK